MKRTRATIAILIALTAGAAWLASQSSTQTTLQNPPTGADAVFLVKLGLTDKAETKWDGSVTVSSGELVKLIGYQMRIGDLVHPPNRWEASTRAAFQFQRRPHDEDYLKESGPVFLQPSFYLYVRGGAARLSLATAQGNFAFTVTDVPPASRKLLLKGRVSVERVAYPMLVGRAHRTPARERLTDNDYPSITVARDGAVWVAWQGFDNNADRVFAQRMPSGTAPPHTVSPNPGDVYRTAIAEEEPWKRGSHRPATSLK